MKNLTCACGAVFIACESTDLLAEVETHLAESHPMQLPPPPPASDGVIPIGEHSPEPEVAG